MSNSLSRRAIMAGAASASMFALPAAATAAVAGREPDPILALLQRWKEVLAAEDAGFAAIREMFEQNGYDESVKQLEVAQDELSGQRYDATRTVFDAVPTTLAGMRAKIDFAFSADHVTGLLTDDEELLQNFIDTLYESARMVSVRS